jgi:hypothetical protein
MGRIRDALGSRIGVQIGGSWTPNTVQKEAIAILGKNLPEAIKQGRTEIAGAIVAQLGKTISDTSHTTIQNSTISV